jgi:hypothetical protein
MIILRKSKGVASFQVNNVYSRQGETGCDTFKEVTVKLDELIFWGDEPIGDDGDDDPDWE